MVKVYKVCAVRNGRYVSCCTPRGVGQRTYRIGKWARGVLPGSKLFAFSSLAAAHDFRLSPEVILECEADPPLDFLPAAGRWERTSEDTRTSFLRFWKSRKVSFPFYKLQGFLPTPKGTVGCKRLRPLRQIS